jgi:hypothetical protein
MRTPIWQFWTDWGVKALGTLATLLAVVVALLGSRLRHWISPPRLRIDLVSADGFLGGIYVFDPATGRAQKTADVIWYHVRVENYTRWNPVTGTYIFLQSIEALDESAEFKPFWNGNAALGWRHEPNQQPKNIGFAAECDLCHVFKEPREVRLSPLIKGQAPDLFTKEFKIALTLQARGVEADSNRLRLEISWDGEWSDNPTEMKRHFRVDIPRPTAPLRSYDHRPPLQSVFVLLLLAGYVYVAFFFLFMFRTVLFPDYFAH